MAYERKNETGYWFGTNEPPTAWRRRIRPVQPKDKDKPLRATVPSTLENSRNSLKSTLVISPGVGTVDDTSRTPQNMLIARSSAQRNTQDVLPSCISGVFITRKPTERHGT